MDRKLIEQFVEGGAKLRRAVEGLTPAELRARPGPGKWSIHENVIHLLDSDAIAIDRMKRILTEDNPPLLYADETAYVDRLYSDEQSLEDALTLIEVERVPQAAAVVGLGLHQRGLGGEHFEFVVRVLEEVAGVERDHQPGGVDRVDDPQDAFGRPTQAPVVLQAHHDAALLGCLQA